MIENKQSELDRSTIEVYSDGAASPNPGLSGYGFVIRYLDPFDESDDPKEITIPGSQGFRHSTSSRMEMMGSLAGLTNLEEELIKLKAASSDDKPLPFRFIRCVSDSSYLCGGFTKGWVRNWKTNHWLTRDNNPVKNQDLWTAIDEIMEKFKKEHGIAVRFAHIPGHKGYKFNEECDKMAVAARQSDTLAIDLPYEKIIEQNGSK